MDRRLEVEQLRRSIAMLSPGARDAVGREQALLLTELRDVQGRLDVLKRRLGSWRRTRSLRSWSKGARL